MSAKVKCILTINVTPGFEVLKILLNEKSFSEEELFNFSQERNMMIC